MNNKVLVIGAAFVDIIMKVSKLPKTGEDVTGKIDTMVVGGCAINVFGALQYEKADATLFVPVGEGMYANLVRKRLNSTKVPIIIDDNQMDNGWDICFVEPSGERTFITVQGIEQNWKSEWFDLIDLNEYQYFYLSGYETEDKNSTKVIFEKLDQSKTKKTILFDASPRIRYIDEDIKKRILSNDVIVHCNEEEIEFLSEEKNFENKLNDVYSKTKMPVIVTLGSKGTCIFDNRGKRIIPADKVRVVNTIGAGDTHCGGLLAGLQKGLSIDEAVKLGNNLAGVVVQQSEGNLKYG
ncbi:PfkB family carbohydrate kinase [Pediococcus acidilactici]|uniref:PfkB family carbohydrate kinase n=1 Tax=Pediococcus acidilactici TaxID=1254 RepID=A0AAW8YQD3_PEDAC|nr:PfkB family carbohydrate kinase [Pediococcus acidilactici]MDV2912310.1 PfkB family carbohydrate kinase [Pediococcus acidilactici]WQS17409.1 PfkB family carbohydrate kinase [Pediococcus acidilactici]